MRTTRGTRGAGAEDEGAPRRGGFWATLPGILTAIAAVIGSTAGLVSIFDDDGGGGDSGDGKPIALVVPNVVEEAQSDARAIIRRRDLEVGRVTRACSSQPEGTVVGQRPDAGTPADRADPVSLTVSSGERPGEISFPSQGAALPDAFRVRGHVCAVSAGRHVWLFTETDGLYPADEVAPTPRVTSPSSSTSDRTGPTCATASRTSSSPSARRVTA